MTASAVDAKTPAWQVKTSHETTTYELLRDGAARWPDRVLVQLESGETWTWARALQEGARAANVLASRGVGPRDRVMMPLPNGETWLRAWWGATLLGAMFVAVNPNLRGRLLTEACDLVDPTAIVALADVATQLDDAAQQLVVTPAELSEGSEEVDPLESPPKPWDPCCLLMTSGTTGPSKASITTHAYVCSFVDFLVDECGLGADDVFQGDMPWFHLSGMAPALQMMRVGGTIVVRSAPAMSSYWSTAKELGSTFSIAPGTVSQFLSSQPPTRADRDHYLRFMFCAPLPDDPQHYMDRFGLDGLVTAYGLTETNLVACSTLRTPWRAGSGGRVRPGYEIRIVDEHDYPVPPGAVGELTTRCHRPWLQSQGYFKRPEESAALWRNGWLHTGDAVRVDSDGYCYFVDRYKDAIRRRGENISSYEVEREVTSFPGVLEAACVAYPAEFGGDDEVKVFVVAASDVGVDFHAMLMYLTERMPYHMVPRFYQLIDQLPKTPTQRVQKHVLRAAGNSDATWDRQQAGYRLTRAGLVTE
ncbi:AMP-binding protein [Mycobacterium sp. Aquia_216]|uniref:AMP-binding protein n=1 Tax=Mycobacterium sp. Aquia_216 TaxID=2991729 RepID=UPI00227B33AC|nr:AMP-binding protein [Mycobacterium sp. Aquia_216]WAJ45345.1 AMP-binding protein [Mycobacterium sp. Aquia_216]